MFGCIRAKRGFTLVEIMIVVAIIGILVAIAVPGFINARKQSRAKACLESQEKMDGAVQEWALETGAGSTDTPVEADLIGTATTPSYLTKVPVCPVGPTKIVIPAAAGTSACPNAGTEADHVRKVDPTAA